MEIEYKIKHLQMLIEDYQQKIKDYEYWKDHFAILQHQFQNKEEISVQHRIPKDYVQHLGLDTEKFTDMCKIEIARKIADHLIKSNSIEIIISENNIYGGNHYEIGCNFTFIP
jgi:hypothetical protein